MTDPEIPRRNFLGLLTYGLTALAAWCGLGGGRKATAPRFVQTSWGKTDGLLAEVHASDYVRYINAEASIRGVPVSVVHAEELQASRDVEYLLKELEIESGRALRTVS